MAKIPGLPKLIEKLPELASPRGVARAVLTFVLVLGVALALLLFADARWPFIAILVQLAIYVASYWLFEQAVLGRKLRIAYADAFFMRLLPVLGLAAASIAYMYLANGGAEAAEFRARVVPSGIGVLMALYFGVTGLILMIRAALAFGADTVALIYNYFPDEGKWIESPLHKLMRHPIYAGIDRIALACALLNGSAYALLLAVFFVFAWHPRAYAVEEQELLERFGDTYDAYMDATPAIQPSLPRGELALLESLSRR